MCISSRQIQLRLLSPPSGLNYAMALAWTSFPSMGQLAFFRLPDIDVCPNVNRLSSQFLLAGPLTHTHN
jgi:hypothetical protein